MMSFHMVQELHGFPAINDPVVVAQRHVHHGSDADLAVVRHRTVLDGMHPQNGTLPAG